MYLYWVLSKKQLIGKVPIHVKINSRSYCPNLNLLIQDKVWEHGAIALSIALVVPIGHRDVGTFQVLPKQDSELREIKQSSLSFHRKVELIKKSTRASSPFPMLDTFVSNVLANRQCVHGNIRSFYQEKYDLCDSCITYNMAGKRWCENVNRCHKSNNLTWNVSIKTIQYW